MAENFSRSWDLSDINIISRAKGGDGRTVEAYCAVFDSPTEIRDQHGHYMETIGRSAFNRTLANNGASRTLVLYNHGLDIHGQSGGLASVPIGKSLEIRADSRGLLTVTRYNNSDLADAVLESIRNDEITGYSFRGRIYRSEPDRVPRARHGAPLPTVTRRELGLSDYGPTPSPAYKDAAIVAVRSLGYSVNETDSAPEDSTNSAARASSLAACDGHSARELELVRLRARTYFEL